MTDERKFYKLKFVFEVLSEEPLPLNLGLAEIAQACDDGPCVGRMGLSNSRKVSGKAMSKLLYEFGSQPEFFMLDDFGRPAAR